LYRQAEGFNQAARRRAKALGSHYEDRLRGLSVRCDVTFCRRLAIEIAPIELRLIVRPIIRE